MKQANQTITKNYLQWLNQQREPVTYQKLSKLWYTPKGDYFFDASKRLTSLEHKIWEYLLYWGG